MQAGTKSLKLIKMTPRLSRIVETGLKRKALRQMKKQMPLIESNKPQKNFYGSNLENQLTHEYLASSGWGNRKSHGDYFIIYPQTQNIALPQQTSSKKSRSFQDLGIDENIIQALNNMDIKEPSNIQMKAIPELLKGKNALISAETGNGKTLSYVIPIVQSILERQNLSPNQPSETSPQAIIVVPTRELAHQVKDVCRELTSNFDIRTATFVGGRLRPIISSKKAKEIDILVSTAGAVKMLVNSDYVKLNKCHHLVIDEVDTLLDDSFQRDMKSIFMRFSIRQPVVHAGMLPGKTQLIMVGATLPQDFRDVFANISGVSDLKHITTPQLHKLPGHVKHTFHKLSLRLKMQKLLEITKKCREKSTPTIVFCNTSYTARFVHNFLRESNVTNSLVTSKMKTHERRTNFEDFKCGKTQILVASDVVSRGIDTQEVECVINYEFPKFMSDYIHRSGRTGRIGGSKNAEVISFVQSYNNELVQKIELATRRKVQLPDVDANIRKFWVNRTEERNAEKAHAENKKEEAKNMKEDIKKIKEMFK